MSELGLAILWWLLFGRPDDEDEDDEDEDDE